MEVSKIIMEAIEKKGLRTLKDISKTLGISAELVRVILSKRHIPKDKTLVKIAQKLGIEKTVLLLAAHRQKVPAEAKGYFLSPTKTEIHRIKRVYPLSEEQCNYLGMIMSHNEIQIIRKFRQLTEDGKTQVVGYVDYVFAQRTTGLKEHVAASMQQA